MQAVTLFEDMFEVTALNPNGYIFERVNRVQATGATFECDMLLDIHSQIYSLRESDKFTFVLASTLHLDGSPADHYSYIPLKGGGNEEPTLADDYDYVMHGRIFNVTWCRAQNWQGNGVCKTNCGCNKSIHEEYDNFVIVAASFGGLLMRLVGDPRHLTRLYQQPDQRLYLLLKKH